MINNPLHIGVIGFGYWGPNIVRVLSENSNVQQITICDSNLLALEAAKLRFPKSEVTSDFNNLLNDNSIQSIIIATPVKTHFAIAKACLLANKHVLCEKPLSDSSHEIITLSLLAQERNLTLMAGHVFEYHTVVQHMRKRIATNELGRIYYLQFNRNGLGPIREDVSVIADLATHDIAIANYLLKAKPLSVSAKATSFFKTSMPDIAFLDLEYAQQIHVNIHVSWIDAIKQRQMKIVGEKKMMIFDDIEIHDKLKIVETGKNYQDKTGSFASFQHNIKDGQVIYPNVQYTEPLAEELNHFIHCMQTGEAPLSGTASALAIAQVLESISVSISRKGESIQL
jgi:predicted dehydrogenase